MATTASALLDTLRYELDSSASSDAQLLEILNRRQTRLMRDFDFSWLERVTSQTVATATGAGYLTFAQATDVKSISALYYMENNQRIPIPYLDFFEALSVYPDSTKAGKPEKWSEYQETIHLFPKANTALTIERYEYRFLPDLTLTASNNFVSLAADALLHGLKGEHYLVMGEDSKAQVEQQLEADAIKSILAYHTRARERRRSSTIPNTPGKIG